MTSILIFYKGILLHCPGGLTHILTVWYYDTMAWGYTTRGPHQLKIKRKTAHSHWCCKAKWVWGVLARFLMLCTHLDDISLTGSHPLPPPPPPSKKKNKTATFPFDENISNDCLTQIITPSPSDVWYNIWSLQTKRILHWLPKLLLRANPKLAITIVLIRLTWVI